jgi:hypothetical protein
MSRSQDATESRFRLAAKSLALADTADRRTSILDSRRGRMPLCAATQLGRFPQQIPAAWRRHGASQRVHNARRHRRQSASHERHRYRGHRGHRGNGLSGFRRAGAQYVPERRPRLRVRTRRAAHTPSAAPVGSAPGWPAEWRSTAEPGPARAYASPNAGFAVVTSRASPASRWV